ncbi:MAG: spore coat U domain-containing protein [Thermodesulfobacteriota bacterium]
MSRWISLLWFALLCFGFVVESRADCNFITVTDVNFGVYDTLVGTNNDSTGSLRVSCTTFDIITTSIGPSPNSGGFNPRSMLNTATGELLNYNLYTTSARTTIWGDGSAGTSRLVNIIWSGGSSFTRTIYGRIPPGQDVGIGLYGDLLVITISF